MSLLKVCLFLFYLLVDDTLTLEFKYHSQDELEEVLIGFSENVTYPLQARVYSIGESVQGRDLLVFELTAAQNNSETVPNVRFTGNLHGNEPTGREILLHFIEFLIENYDKNERVHWLLDNTKFHIIPCLNPDGWEKAEPGKCQGLTGRCNQNNVDLNRNFPDFISENRTEEQVETEALRNWMTNVSFVLAGDLHGGSVVAIYPFHRIIKSIYGYEMQSSITPDNNIFLHLANVYAVNNEFMYHQPVSCDNEKFPGGVTRGAAWYYFLGGMQDYSYIVHGTMALTFEIFCCKYPPESDLPIIWEQNKNSLLMFSSEANRGVTASLKDSKTREPITNANITVLGIDKTFHPDTNGRFWKILLPGKYYLRIESDSYETVENTFSVESDETKFPVLTELAIDMYKIQ